MCVCVVLTPVGETGCETAGMITKTEIKLLDGVNTPHGKWWVPFVWACNLVRAARRQGRISDNYLMKTLLDVRMLLIHIILACISFHLVAD